MDSEGLAWYRKHKASRDVTGSLAGATCNTRRMRIRPVVDRRLGPPRRMLLFAHTGAPSCLHGFLKDLKESTCDEIA